MCGRYYIPEAETAQELRAIIDEIQRRDREIPLKRGEIFPTDVAPVLANNRSMVVRPFAMTWGYRRPGGGPVINARSETASARPMFRDGMLQRRCLIPATHYFEWEQRGNGRVKYAIAAKDSPLFYMAGIYRMEKGVPTFAILTREAAACIAFIHDRMPVILPRDALAAWLDVRNDADEVLRAACLDLECAPC